MEYPVPSRSKRAWAAQRIEQNRVQNPALIFDRFAPEWSENAQIKKEGINDVLRAARNADLLLLQFLLWRWSQSASSVGASPFCLKTNGRLVVGLGAKGPLEVGFTFHRCGFPLIPGSSLKGLARVAGLLEIATALGVNEPSILDDLAEKLEKPDISAFARDYPSALQLGQDFRAVFGTTDASGKAVFLDALPDSHQIPTINIDILNPHYADYYATEGSTPPNDDLPLSRISNFIAVSPGVHFWFGLGWKGQHTIDPEKRQYDLAVKWLKLGLCKLGVGAKTAAGYGYFIPVQNIIILQPNPLPIPVAPSQQITRRGRVTRPRPPTIPITDLASGNIFIGRASALRNRGRTPRDGDVLEFVTQDDEVLTIIN